LKFLACYLSAIAGDRSRTGFTVAHITILAGLVVILCAVIRPNTKELVLVLPNKTFKECELIPN
jgi:hypothetical protein